MAGRMRDAAETRRKLLAAAEAVFIEHGFDGARVDDIAARAGVNKRMIYEYYGNKEELYFRVLKVNYDRVFEAERTVIRQSPNAEAALLDGFRRYFEFLAEHPGFIRLVGQEQMSRTPRASEEIRGLADMGLGNLTPILAQGIRDGTFREDLDLRLVLASIASLCMGIFQRRSQLQRLWDIDLDDANTRERVLQHLQTLFLIGVRPRSAREGGAQ